MIYGVPIPYVGEIVLIGYAKTNFNTSFTYYNKY